jgi:hypothetical protein
MFINRFCGSLKLKVEMLSVKTSSLPARGVKNADQQDHGNELKLKGD